VNIVLLVHHHPYILHKCMIIILM